MVTPWDVGRLMGPMPDVLGLIGLPIAVATPVLVTVAAPVVQPLRRTYGRLAADSAEAVTAARATLEAAARGLRFEEEVRARVLTELQRTMPGSPVSAAPWSIGYTYGEPSYAGLSRSVDTLLEIKILEPRLDGGDGINPALRLGVHARIRLIDTRKGRELYYDYLEYRGPSTRPFVEWAEDDARALRDEVQQCVTALAAEIVAQVFVRPSTQRVDAAGLAVTGIRHRPLSSPAAVQPPMPPVRPIRMAQR